MLRVIGSIFILSIYLFGANVRAYLDKIAVIKGDRVTLTIEASGGDVQFPKINTIAGYNVVGSSTMQNISIINGKMRKTYVKSFDFFPTKDAKIEPFEIIIDGKTYKTKQLEIKVLPPKQSKNGDRFVLELKTNKLSAYVGEAILLEFIFKYKVGSSLSNVSLDQFNQKDFWIKKLPLSKPLLEQGYIVQKQPYLIFAQKSGSFTIPSYEAIVSIDDFGFYKRKRVFSNSLKLDIKPLPKGVYLVGDFNIRAKTDKVKTKINEPINLTITVDGIGNIDDIEDFKIDIENVISYNAKPIIKTDIKDNKYSGKFIQKISLIADSNFTIPSFSIKYFDKNKNKIIIKKTQPIKIEVFGHKDTTHIQIPKKINKVKIVYKEKNSYLKYIYFIVGFILGIIFILVALKIKKLPKNKDELPLVKKIKKAKNNKELYNILLPYINDDKIKHIVSLLEENIYKNSNYKIDKKQLIEYFQHH